MSIVGQTSEESRLQSFRSFALGFAMLSVAYMVPVLGFATWTLVTVFSLGAAMTAFIAAYRREHPAAAPRLASGAPPPVPYPPYQPHPP